MRFLSAGESHGKYMGAILDGFPKGVTIDIASINGELRRRMSGAGRGPRMKIERDAIEITSGLRNRVTLGSPICVLVKNKDHKIFTTAADRLSAISIPRPAHADLAGSLKYQEKDIRNILERASARETVARVCVGALCKQFLSNFNIRIASHTVSVGSISLQKKPEGVSAVLKKTKSSSLNCTDLAKERLMVREIADARSKGDTLGGTVEVLAGGVICGLGSFSQFDHRLDARLAYYLMSIPAIKGVEIGEGFAYSTKRGSQAHDAIYHAKNRGFYHRTNNSGGIEGGLTTGEVIRARVAMKPIATLTAPLDSVDIATKKKTKASVIRSDVCAVTACGVIAESMLALCLTEALLDKFGRDSLKEIKANYKSYLKQLQSF